LNASYSDNFHGRGWGVPQARPAGTPSSLADNLLYNAKYFHKRHALNLT